MITAAELRRMRQAFLSLPKRNREIFASVSVADLGFAEAAARHSCTVAEVEQTVARVLIALNRAAESERP